MVLITNWGVVSLALIAGLVAAPATFAQSAPPAPVQLVQAETAQPAEEQLVAFVTATVHIMAIQQQAQQEMMATEEPAVQEQVRDQALQMIVAAVEDEGLTVAEYNGIVEQIEADPELGQTVQGMIQERLSD